MEKNLTPLLVVAAAIVSEGPTVLLHRRPEGSDHAGLWEFPGGKVEEGENVRTALVREIAEECGLILHAGSLAAVSFAAGEGGGTYGEIVLLLFSTSVFTGAPRSLEGGEWKWFPLNQAYDLPMQPLDRELLAALIADQGAGPEERGLPTR